MANTCQSRARTEVLLSSLASSGSNITIEVRRINARLSRKTLKEVPLSERPFFLEGLHLVQENLLGSCYSILRFEQLNNLH